MIERLRHEKDIQNTLKKGRNIFDSLCGMRFVQNQLSITRLSIVIGTKVNKRAVVRNKLRRQYREISRLMEPAIKPGFDILLFPSISSIKATYEQKRESLQKILEKNQLLG